MNYFYSPPLFLFEIFKFIQKLPFFWLFSVSVKNDSFYSYFHLITHISNQFVSFYLVVNIYFRPNRYIFFLILCIFLFFYLNFLPYFFFIGEFFYFMMQKILQEVFFSNLDLILIWLLWFSVSSSSYSKLASVSFYSNSLQIKLNIFTSMQTISFFFIVIYLLFSGIPHFATIVDMVNCTLFYLNFSKFPFMPFYISASFLKFLFT